MEKTRVGFALCGSFCTFSKVIPEMKRLVEMGYDVFPIMSEFAYATDTRFGTAEEFHTELQEITGKEIIHTIAAAEPIGPKKMFDVLIIAPCTGNTLGKLTWGITDSCVTMAAKAHIRNARPVILAVSTNDGLGASAKNIGALQNTKHIFFVPYEMDDYLHKPSSLVADFPLIPQTVEMALKDVQIQPLVK